MLGSDAKSTHRHKPHKALWASRRLTTATRKTSSPPTSTPPSKHLTIGLFPCPGDQPFRDYNETSHG